MFVSWSDIEGFHAVRRAVAKHPHILGGRGTVTYRGKVKLHGTNAGVYLHGDDVFAQSRSQSISPGPTDNAGFAAWVESTKEKWQEASKRANQRIIVYGEWCGPGVQKGVAISQIPNRCFAVFAARGFSKSGEPSDDLIISPDELSELVRGVPNVYVLPWHTGPLDAQVIAEAESLQPYIDTINESVKAIEEEDPWVAETFGVKGTGEGLVFYPISHSGAENFSNLAFKAKGEKHRVVVQKEAAQIDPEIVDSAGRFADLVLTPARLEQGARAITKGELEFDMKLMGPFLKWVNQDVQKETTAELEASGLEWKQVQKTVQEKARLWYTRQVHAS